MTVDDVANARQISEIGRDAWRKGQPSAVEVYAHPGSCGVPLDDIKGFVGQINRL